MSFSELSLKLREFVFPEELELKSFHVENTVRGWYGSCGEGWSRLKQYLSRELGNELGKGSLVLSKMCHCSGMTHHLMNAHHLYMQWCCLGNRL